MAFKSRVLSETEKHLVKVWDMAIGRVGRISGAVPYSGHLVLRTYEGIVSLKDPSKTWPALQVMHPPQFDIELLPDGTVVEITSGEVSNV